MADCVECDGTGALENIDYNRCHNTDCCPNLFMCTWCDGTGEI